MGIHLDAGFVLSAGFGQSDKPLEVSFYHTNNTSGIMTAMLEQLQVRTFLYRLVVQLAVLTSTASAGSR